ncbi:WD40 repeat domain-containing serine/threonine protein kinase [Hyalangium versicolor]|uniref:WD40 repeat domain-containing serine/threonine protein kinase n=1 Tax=Hyalangium versicolor TaxID=2861190 RepID=UPI001CCD63A8|nr:serine/threonine-protein kinase [Hyalangium versicolor]
MEALSLGEALLRFAADAVVPLVEGAVAALSLGIPGLGIVASRAIGYFGPIIVKRWMDWGRNRSDKEWDDAFVDLSALPPSRANTVAGDILKREVPGASEGDKRLVLGYLSAIPSCVSHSLQPEARTGRLTLPPVPSAERLQQLLAVLPIDPLPFIAPCPFPGTPYSLEELVGVGGFGAVYRATLSAEQYLPRAIKVCLNPSMRSSLEHERALLDRLSTEGRQGWPLGVVRLYGYELSAAHPFLVYEFVRGSNLGRLVAWHRRQHGRPQSPSRILDIIRQLTEALASVHARNFVHRDLKPANILVDESGTVRITDFGIGGVVTGEETRTRSLQTLTVAGSRMLEEATLIRGAGTPLYMSPEQFRGESSAAHHDIYSLGVIWYQMLAGDVQRPMFPCWADELAEEYQAPREHIELIRACVGYAKRRPKDGAAFLHLLPAVRSTPVAVPSSVTSPDSVSVPTPKPLRPTTASPQQVAVKRLPDPGKAKRLRAPVPPDPMGATHVFSGHEAKVNSVAISADGRHLLSGADDGKVLLWKVGHDKPIAYLQGHQAEVTSVAFSQDLRHAISGSRDRSVRYWDLDERYEEVWQIRAIFQASVIGVAFYAGNLIAVACGDLSLYSTGTQFRLLDLEHGTELVGLDGGTAICSMGLSESLHQALFGEDRGILEVWDLNAPRRRIRDLQGHSDRVTCLWTSPDGRHCLSGSGSPTRKHWPRDTTVRYWDLAEGRELRCFRKHSQTVTGVALLYGQRAVSTSRDGTMRVWSLSDGEELHRIDVSPVALNTATISADGHFLAAGGEDGVVRLWPLPG